MGPRADAAVVEVRVGNDWVGKVEVSGGDKPTQDKTEDSGGTGR